MGTAVATWRPGQLRPFMLLSRGYLHIVQALETNEVMRLVAKGDSRAFGQLYDKMAGAVFGVVLKVLRDRHQAEEVAQEVFAKAWGLAPTWQPERGSAATFILMIARRTAIDRVRSEEARKHREAKSVLQHVQPDVAHEEIERQQTSERVRAALGQLGDEQREVVTLAFFGGWTHAEISHHLKIPLGTVKSRMYGGMSNLRRTLEALR